MSVSTSRAGADPSRVRALLAVGALALGLLGSLVTPLLTRDTVSDPQAFVRALDSVRGELAPGATVLVQPPWRHDVLAALDEAGLPSGTQVTVALARPHGAALPAGLVVLRDPGLPVPRALRRLLASARTSEVEGVEVSLVDPAAAAPAATRARGRLLDDELARARVSVEKSDGTVVECRYLAARDRHVCPGLPDWMWVGRREQASGGESRPCLWAHPTSGGTVRIRFPDVALGASLALSHSLSDHAVQTGGDPVDTTVSLDGQPLGRARRSNAAGWTTQTFDVPRAGERGEVGLDVTVRSDGARHYCLSLAFVEEAP